MTAISLLGFLAESLRDLYINEYLLHAEGEKRELFFRRNKIFFYGKTQREFSYLTSEASLVSEFKLSFAIKKDFVESKKVHVEHLQHATCSFVPHFPHFENRVCLDWGISIHRCCVNTTRTSLQKLIREGAAGVAVYVSSTFAHFSLQNPFKMFKNYFLATFNTSSTKLS